MGSVLRSRSEGFRNGISGISPDKLSRIGIIAVVYFKDISIPQFKLRELELDVIRGIRRTYRQSVIFIGSVVSVTSSRIKQHVRTPEKNPALHRYILRQGGYRSKHSKHKNNNNFFFHHILN